MKRLKPVFLMIFVLLCLPLLVCAETITLKTGETVEGKLLEKTDQYAKIDFQGVVLTYFYDEIKSIDGKPVDSKKEAISYIDISNPGYAKPPDESENIKITEESNIADMLKKIEYFYATRDFGKAIELGEAALKKTDNKELLGAIHYSLSSNYLEKGIDLYNKNKDDSYYLLSIEHAKKALEVYPDSWQAWGNIGTVYFNMRDWKQAVYYITEAEKYLDKNNPSYASIEFTRRLADGMLKQNQ